MSTIALNQLLQDAAAAARSNEFASRLNPSDVQPIRRDLEVFEIMSVGGGENIGTNI